MAGYYDPNKDYSKAISEAKAAGKDTSKLEAERQNKINDPNGKYKGVEPTMYGSDKTYSQASRDDDRDTISNAIAISNSKYSGGSSGGSSGSNTSTFNGITYTQQPGTGIYGVPTINSDVKNYTQGGVTYQVGADMSRRPDLAGQVAISNGYTVFYDENGYATKAIKGVADYTPQKDYNASNGTYNQSGAWTDNEMLTQSQLDLIQSYRDAAAAGQMTWADANAKANAIRAGYGYTIDNKGNVTNSGALAAVNDRRQQIGLDTNPESGETAYYRYLMGTDTSPLAQATGQVKSFEQFAQENGLNTGAQAAPVVTAPAIQDLTSVSPYAGGSVSGGINLGSYGGNDAGASDAFQYLRDMYAQQAAAQLAALKSTYEQNVLDYQAQDDLISAEAQRQRNRVAAQNDLQRMYMNEMGIMHGLNTGATGQMALAQSAGLQSNLASIGTQEQQSLADNGLALAKLKAQYSAAVYQAVADGNYQLAQALYNEYVRQDEIARQQQAAALEQANWLAKFNYQQAQDALDQQNWQAQFDYQKQQDDLNYQLALMKLNAQKSTASKTNTTGTDGGNAIVYGNGSLTPTQVRTLQADINKYLPEGQKIAEDGIWGAKTAAAAGGMTADQYAKIYYKQNAWSGRSDR